jgi:virulence-associated protein VapD
MFAIAFDLVVTEAERLHPKGFAQAYANVRKTLSQFGFERVQGSAYVTQNENMANLFSALIPLRSLPWFPPTVRNIRAFRIEQWSDFTPLMKNASTSASPSASKPNA